MAYNTLDPNKTAVLFFDMLNAYVHASPEMEKASAPVVANCVKLRTAAKQAGIPIFYAQANHRPDEKDVAKLYSDTGYNLQPWKDPENEYIGKNRKMKAGTWEIEIIDELRPDPDDYVIKKHRWSAFFQTSLELSLRTRGIDTIVLCGGAVPVGIASTAFAARDLDYNLVIARDCCSGGDSSFDFFMDRVFPFMARVRTSDQIIEMIRK